jgi:tetratricopeptide (TPR) repeat protein
VDAATSKQLWSDRYDRDLADTFAIQTDVALDIARTLGTKLTASETQLVKRVPTADPEAYDLYLRGSSYLWRSMDEADNQAAKALLEQAITRDPSFAAAHALLSMADSFLNVQDCPGAKQHADLALTLQPGLPEGYAAQGIRLMHCATGHLDAVRAANVEHDYGAAIDYLKRAVLGAPGDATFRMFLSWAHIDADDLQEGLQTARSAAELDPRSPQVLAHYARVLRYVGEYDLAERRYARSLALESSETVLLESRYVLLLRDGRPDLARHQLERWLNTPDRVVNKTDQWIAREFPELFLRFAAAHRLSLGPEGEASAVGFAHFLLGHRDEAKAHFALAMNEAKSSAQLRPEMPKSMLHGKLAYYYAGLGRPDEALAELSKSSWGKDWHVLFDVALLRERRDEALVALDHLIEQERYGAAYLRVSPIYASLRSDPRFEQILAKHERKK